MKKVKDYMTIPDNNDFNFSNGDFTLDIDIRINKTKCIKFFDEVFKLDPTSKWKKNFTPPTKKLYKLD